MGRPLTRLVARDGHQPDHLAPLDVWNEQACREMMVRGDADASAFVTRVVHRDGPLFADRAPAGRVLGEGRIGVEFFHRPGRPDRVAVGEVGLRREEIETVDGERVLRRLVDHPDELVKLAHARERERGVASDLQLDVLFRELVGPLPQQRARLLSRTRDERGDRDDGDEREEADDAEVEHRRLASEEDLPGHRRDEADDGDRAGEERSRDPHAEDRREDRQHVEREVPGVDAAGQDEEDRRDDLRRGGADREPAVSQPVVREHVEPEGREEKEERRAREEADPRRRIGRGKRRRPEEGRSDTPARDLRRHSDAALVRGARPLIRGHIADMVGQLG